MSSLKLDVKDVGTILQGAKIVMEFWRETREARGEPLDAPITLEEQAEARAALHSRTAEVRRTVAANEARSRARIADLEGEG